MVFVVWDNEAVKTVETLGNDKGSNPLVGVIVFVNIVAKELGEIRFDESMLVVVIE